MIEKGYVSAVLDGGKKVTVIPAFSGDVVSHELIVPFFLIGTMQTRKEVVYCSFPDNTGVVIASMDGTWNHNLDGDVKITGKITAASVAASGAITGDSVTASGKVSGSSVNAGSVSLGGHTHEYSKGGTGTGTTGGPK